jgi:hypothetical protein
MKMLKFVPASHPGGFLDCYTVSEPSFLPGLSWA